MARPHPADDFNAAIIANAVEWTAFIQAGGRLVQRLTSEIEARAAAQDVADHLGRPALVYAINAAGRQALSPPMSATEIAKLTA